MSKLDVYRGKKILVTGHTGFKGSWLCLWLKMLGAEVYGFSHSLTPSNPNLFSAFDLGSQVESKIARIEEPDAFATYVEDVKPDLAIHMAAQSLVLQSYKDPIDTFSSNVMGSVRFLEAVRNSSFLNRAIFVTSDKCYANDDSGRWFLETDAMGGKDPYSASKGCAELVFASYQASFMTALPQKSMVTVRAGNVIGGGDWSDNRLIPDCMRAWFEKSKVVIRSPEAIRPWQHVFDVLGGYLLIGAQLFEAPQEIRGEAFNLGPGSASERTVADLLKALKSELHAALPCDYEVDKQAAKVKEAKTLHLNVEKIKQRWGWQNTLSFTQAVQWTAQWYAEFFAAPKTIAAFSKRQIEAFLTSCTYFS